MKTPAPDKHDHPDKPAPGGNGKDDGDHPNTNGTDGGSDGQSNTDKTLPKTGDTDSMLTAMIGILRLWQAEA